MMPLVAVAYASPVLCWLIVGDVGELNGFHHLTEKTIGKDHYGGAELIGHIESLYGICSHFLNGAGSIYGNEEVVVAACLGCKIIVGLCGLDTAETGAASLNVYDDAGKVAACGIGDTL